MTKIQALITTLGDEPILQASTTLARLQIDPQGEE